MSEELKSKGEPLVGGADGMAQEAEAADRNTNPAGSEANSSAGASEAGTDSNAAGLDELIGLRVRLESAESQLASQKDEVLRTQAEMQNVRRRAERDVENAHKFALEKFVNELLPVIDSLERGLESVSVDDPAVYHR